MDKKIEGLAEQLKTLQDTLNTHINDTDTEAKDNQPYRLEVVKLRGEFEELRKVVNKLIEKTTDRFAQAMEPILEEAQDLKKVIDKKKTIIVPEKKKHWYKFWRR